MDKIKKATEYTITISKQVTFTTSIMIGTYWSDEISQSELEEVKSKGYNVEIKKYVEPEPRVDSMPF